MKATGCGMYWSLLTPCNKWLLYILLFLFSLLIIAYIFVILLISWLKSLMYIRSGNILIGLTTLELKVSYWSGKILIITKPRRLDFGTLELEVQSTCK